MPKITPFLWFTDNRAEEAIAFYCSIFPQAKVTYENRMREDGPVPKGEMLVAEFELDGQTFIALNGGGESQFNEAVSFLISCNGQDEVDYYWDKLLDGGGEPIQCGWLKDKFGVRWQVTPDTLLDYINDPDPERATKAMNAMMQMVKIDINEIARAADA